MLAAGTFLLARVYPIMTMDARLIAAVLGCVTLATGALVALVQTDIRKILAWSTVSQGGYVLLFLGSGGYTAGLLYLFTHAIIKTALFLAAGSVLHGLAAGSEAGHAIPATADIRQMGGLWKRFPITAVAALAAVLALANVPWSSGAYVTNLGLACAYDYAQALGGHWEWWLVGVPTAATVVTALGIGRWWWLIFAGTNRKPKLFENAHETPFLTLPIVILAGLTIGLRFEFTGVILPLVVKSIPVVLTQKPPLVVEGSDEGMAVVIPLTGWAFVGLLAAAGMYWRGFALPNRWRRLPVVGWVDYWLRERMFLDELYEGVLVAGVLLVGRGIRAVEWLGRGIVNIVGLVLSLLIGGIARIEKVHQAEPLPPAPASEAEGDEG